MAEYFRLTRRGSRASADTALAHARELLAKNPVVLRAAKLGYKHTGTMSWDQAEDYLYAKLEQSQFLDAERGREQGLEQFLDEKRIKPGLQTYERTADA